MSGLALLCPGQGGQHPAMLELAAATPRGAVLLRRCAVALGWDPLARARAGGADLFANSLAQPLVCAAELATWEAIRAALPPPRVVLGYSLGELAAYACAGAIGPEDAVALAVRRAELMDAASPKGGGLVALRGLSVERGEALAALSGAEIAIVNGPDHLVAGGRAEALAELSSRAERAGATAVPLPVCVPAHTRLLAAAVAPFAEALARSALVDPPIPVLAGTTAVPVRTRAAAITALSAQLATRIEWASCVVAASELGCTVFLELGPGSALAKMAGELVPGAAVRSVVEFRTVEGIARWVERSLESG